MLNYIYICYTVANEWQIWFSSEQHSFFDSVIGIMYLQIFKIQGGPKLVMQTSGLITES